MIFFFFKQKTAYEMRISDWSSDVCSSDLRQPERPAKRAVCEALDRPAVDRREQHCRNQHDEQRERYPCHADRAEDEERDQRNEGADHEDLAMGEIDHADDAVDHRVRSEEHTSELQSLMRTSYAVFCLKKKKMP